MTDHPVDEAKDLSEHFAAARKVLEELGLREADEKYLRPASGHNSSLLIPCDGANDRPFLLKYFAPPAEGVYYPAGVKLEDYPRREGAFYRYLDTVDPDRRQVPAPRTIMLDPHDPPQWILLERIPGAVGPAEEILGQDHVFELLQTMHNIDLDTLAGRRNFPLNRWDTVSYLDRVRLMYDPVLFVIGERRWRVTQEFFKEALRWTETRKEVFVHGDFTEQNILVDQEGLPYLIDFERVGMGNPDQDFAWFWIHSTRTPEWKRQLIDRYLTQYVGSERIRSEWGIRAALVYLALRRLRFGYMIYGASDPNVTPNLALLDAALHGGDALFPV